MRKIIWLLIIFFAIWLRFYELGSNPPSLSWDEAALGYNAYSIGQTGRDEFGRFLPYDYFASFGDYKPPLYVYAAVIPIKVFGLNEFAVRFPSALFGVLTVILVYFLVKQLFSSNHQSLLPEISALLFTISPWHINLSRAAFEANLALFFVLLGAYLFLKGRHWLIFSAVSFVASFYTFNSCRAFVPLLLFGLLIFFGQRIHQEKKWLTLAAVAGFILLLPLIPHLRSVEGQLRFKEVNIFSDLQPIELANKRIEFDNGVWWSKLVHNRRLMFVFSYLRHYFDHFHPNFLFLYGDGNPKFSIQDVGQLYHWELPFLLLGIFSLLTRQRKIALFLLFWLFAAPLPAATARETPHALRIENILPTFQIFTAAGLLSFWQWLQKQKSIQRHLLAAVLLGLIIFNFIYYYHNLFFHYPWEYSGEWQFGYKEAVQYVKQNENKYQKVVFTTSLGRPYIYLLFYLQYPPHQFWQNSRVEKESFGFINVQAFDKYEFRNKLTSADNNSQTLYIMTPAEVPAGTHPLKTFSRLNGSTALVAFEKN